MRPLRILIGSDTFSPDINGAARFTERLAAGLVDRGHEVHVVAPQGEGQEVGFSTEVIEGRPMTVERWKSFRWPFHGKWRIVGPWHANRFAKATLDRVQPDVIHLQSHYVVGRGIIKLAKKRGIRMIGTNHSMPENLLDHTGLGPFNWFLLQWAWNDLHKLYGMVDRVTTPTQNAADFLARSAKLGDILAISCGIDASRYRPDFGPRAEHRIVFVGRQDAEKHIDVLIRALPLVDPALDVKLDLVGDGEHRKHLHDIAVKHGVADRVVQHGAVTDERIVELLSQASLFAIASTAELQSIATLEALSSALPVVAADAMALPHLVHDGENGWLFPPGDVAAVADRIERVLRMSPAEREQMQRNALATVKVHSIAHTLDVFEALYRDEPLPQ
ncbi:MAG: glycosyltransferase [Microbacteriaceae bacterium]|nr:glycosyltransferase [Microbacteriaceae bacterium]